MSMAWCRLWHDMPTDPKWRTIAKKSGQRIGDVMAVYNFVLVNASANATERGRTHNLVAEDVATALDLNESDIEAILDAMQGKVIDEDLVMGWEKRQPKREDGSAERAKVWRERNRTQPNAEERSYTDKDKEKDKDKDKDKEKEKNKKAEKRPGPVGPHNGTHSQKALIELAQKPPEVSDQVWQDFQLQRKAKRAPFTVTALRDTRVEAEKAGIGLEEALKMCCRRGWQGFESRYFPKKEESYI